MITLSFQQQMLEATPTEEKIQMNRLDELQNEIDQVREQLHKVRSCRRQEWTTHRSVKMELWKTRVSTEKAMEARLLKSMQNQESPPKVYVDSVVQANTANNEPSMSNPRPQRQSPYVVRLEAKLCRSVHLMIALESQLRLIALQGEEMYHELKHFLAEEESGVQHMSIKQEFNTLDTETSKMQEDYKSTLESQRKAIVQFNNEQSDGLDIVAICRHNEHIILHETRKQMAAVTHKKGPTFPLMILSHLSRSGHSDLAQ